LSAYSALAFSLFNKKPNDPPKPGEPARTATRAPGRTDGRKPEPAGTPVEPSGSDTARKIDDIEAAMTSRNGVRGPAAGGAERRPAKPTVEHGFQSGTRPRTAPAAHATAAAPAKKGAPNSVMMMEVQESPFEAAPALEEAAILYANRQDAAAQGALEEAAGAEDLPAQAARQAWLMLFDLFENQGRRVEFEAAALQFAVRFETSPPAFNDRSTVKSVTARTGGSPQVAFSGRLNAAAAKQFDHLRLVASKNRSLCIDLGKIESISPECCGQMRACLAALAKSGHEVVYAGGAHLLGILTGQVEVGRSDIAESYWLLLLDLYQAHNMQAAFEEAALSYCITYEVSPPSWVEATKKTATVALDSAAEARPAPDDAFYLKGEIEGNGEPQLKGVGDFAAERDSVIIDVFHVKRMDFIAAGALLNLVAALKTAGKQVEVRSPSPLLATLFVTMGFTAYAKLARRKP